MNDDVIVLNSDTERRFAPPSAPPRRPPKGGVGVEVDRELDDQINGIPDKLAFKIGEVADLVGVKPYVLRYWETEFDVLKPKKSKHNQRMYERRDVENLLLIKKLLYRDRFSIEGARGALKRLKKDNQRVQQMRGIGERIEDVKESVRELIDQVRSFRESIR